MNLSNLSIGELERWRRDIDKELDRRRGSHVKEIREYMESFTEKKGLSYYWDAKEAGNAKRLEKKIAFSYRQKRGADPSEEQLIQAIEIFIQFAYELNDSFINSNFSVSILVNQFNKILNAARQETKHLNQFDD